MKAFVDIFPAFISLLVFSSCQYELDLTDIPAEPRLLVYCQPGIGDTTFIQLDRSSPISASDFPNKTDLENITLSVRINNSQQNVYRMKNKQTGFNGITYYVLGERNPGDVIELQASAKGFPSVCAKTIVPADFPLQSVGIGLADTLSESRLRFKIKFQDDLQEDNYYGIRIEEAEIAQRDAEISFHSYPLWLDVSDNMLLNNVTGLDDIFFGNKTSHYQWVFIWDDSLIKGKEYTLEIATRYMPGWETPISENLDELIQVSYAYRVSLYSFSYELYTYLKSMSELDNDNLNSIGLAPIYPSYSNVKQGFGVVGGVRIIQTEWFENPEE